MVGMAWGTRVPSLAVLGCDGCQLCWGGRWPVLWPLLPPGLWLVAEVGRREEFHLGLGRIPVILPNCKYPSPSFSRLEQSPI